MNWFRNNIEGVIVKWLTGAVLTCLTGGIVFYFNVNSTLAQQSIDINKLKEVVEHSDNALNTWKINNLEVKTAEQNIDIKELKREFSEFQKKYNQDQKEILELLYLIKKK